MVNLSRLDQTLMRGYMSQALFFGVLSRALAGYTVIDGLKVQQRAAGANMSVDVDAGNVRFNGTRTPVTGANVAIDMADPTNPRIDILYASTGGALSISKGTAAVIKPVGETTWQEFEEPYPADIKAIDGIPLAEIHVGAGVSSITNANIVMLGSIWNETNDGWISANETWTYASADDPIYTLTISGDKTAKYNAGMRIKLTQTSVKYFIIHKVAYSSPNTTLTLYGGTDYDLANATISANYYSMVHAPTGFPMAESKWTYTILDDVDVYQANPVEHQYYNAGSKYYDFPIGNWMVKYLHHSYAQRSAEGQLETQFFLCTDAVGTGTFYLSDFTLAANSTYCYRYDRYRYVSMELTAKTRLYFLLRAGQADCTNMGSEWRKFELVSQFFR